MLCLMLLLLTVLEWEWDLEIYGVSSIVQDLGHRSFAKKTPTPVQK